jgi:phage-related baseplate assembly protein
MQASIAATLQLESEPLTMLLQLCSYRELLLRQRINEAAKASLLAYAKKKTWTTRLLTMASAVLLITPADPTATPPGRGGMGIRQPRALPLPAGTGRHDSGRAAWCLPLPCAQCQRQCAGRQGDIPQPGTVRVYVMDARSNGVPDQPLLDAVLAYCRMKPASRCATAWKQAGQPRTFTITARLERDADLFAASVASPKRAADWMPCWKPAAAG